MLQVEKVAQDVAVRGLGLVREVPRGYGELADQFKRAVVSVALNTTEALGRKDGNRRNLLAVARGSAKEASVALALLGAVGAVAQAEVAGVEQDLDRVRAMLWRLAA